nr:hypothetical protein [Tanacetum cinerariifolium]
TINDSSRLVNGGKSGGEESGRWWEGSGEQWTGLGMLG